MKKNSVLYYSFLFSFLFFASCRHNGPDKSDKVKSVELEVHFHEESVSMSEEFTDFRIIPLENRKECLLSNVCKMIVTDQNMYFWDKGPSSQVLRFDLNGKFNSRIGREGHAKGEYVSIQDIAATSKGDTIVMVNIPDICLYNKEGKYLSSLPIKNEKGIENILFTDNAIYLGYFHRQENSVMAVYNKEAKRVADIVETQCDPIRKTLGVDNASLLQQDGDYVICLDALNSCFYVSNKNNLKDVTKYSFKYEEMLTEDIARKSVEDDEGLFRITSYQFHDGIVRGIISNNTEYYDFKFHLSANTVDFMHHKEYDYSFACNHSGSFYYIVSTDVLLYYMDKSNPSHSPICELLSDAFSELQGKILRTDNFYVIKMHVK